MIHVVYSPVLIAVSVVIAIFASYTALDLASSVSGARGRIRTVLLTGGSLAMGVGIWSMHFVGMLAFRLVRTPIAYDIPLLILSIVVAIIASAIALFVVSRRGVPLTLVIVAGLSMGAAISGMHYIGIWSMRQAAHVTWDDRLVVASITIAIVAAFAALWLAFRSRSEPGARGVRNRLAGGIVMGLAISGMHYTAMLAMHFTPRAAAGRMRGAGVLATDGLAVAVTGSTLLILVIALTGSFVERALAVLGARADEAEERVRVEESLRRELEASEARFRFLAEASSVLASSLDYHGTLTSVARLAVQHTADYCLVDVVDAGGEEVRRVAVAHRDPAGEVALRQVERFPPGAGSPLADVLRAGTPRLIPDLTPDVLRAIARSDEHLAIIQELGPQSSMIVPLIARGHSLGIMTFASTSRHYDEDDLATAEELARRAALAVDNAQLYKSALVANQAKSEFLAVVSHELRTPLNAIMGYADLLDAGIPAPLEEAQQKQVRRIHASAKHLLELVNDILTFSRIEADREQVAIETVDIAELVHDVAAMIEPLAQEKGLRFDVAAPVMQSVQTDPGMVRQILLNLLSNAVKFTERGGIEVNVRRDKDRLLLNVRDSGIGIPPEHRERIFNPFWQVEQGMTRRRGGTGLGLTVTRRLAQLLGGDVAVTSVPGQGSNFTIQLPAKMHPAHRAPNAAAADRSGAPPRAPRFAGRASDSA